MFVVTNAFVTDIAGLAGRSTAPSQCPSSYRLTGEQRYKGIGGYGGRRLLRCRAGRADGRRSGRARDSARRWLSPRRWRRPALLLLALVSCW